MEGFIAIFSILYSFWPLTLLFGLHVLFVSGTPFWERMRQAVKQVFIAWSAWAVFWGYLALQGREPVLLLPKPLNHSLFFSLGAITGGITLAGWFHQIRHNRIRLNDARTLDDLLAMSPEDFETLVAELFRAYGHQAEVAGGKGDHGVDVVVLTGEGEKWIVQCKRYNGSVGEPVVRDLYGTLLHEEAQKAYILTTGSFTRQAAAWAVGKPIMLYDGEGLVKLIRRTQDARAKKAI